MEKIKLFTAFAGYGTDNFALKQLRIPFELVGFSEIDKYAVKCFEQNHSGKNFGDIRLINVVDLPDFDLFTGGFPCQAFSVAGKMNGELDSRGTLFYEIIRICEVKKPKWIFLENVKGLTCTKFKPTFDKIINELNRIGYNVYWKILNTKDFGIPQSRARVFFVCFRKDIDVPMKFQFPEPFPLKIFIKDILEESVDKKYYLSEKLQERFKRYLEDKKDSLVLQKHHFGEIIEYDEVMPTLRKQMGDNTPYIFEAGRKDWRTHKSLVPTLKERMGTGGNNVPMVQQQPIILTGLQEHQSVKKDGISNTLPTAMGDGGGHIPIVVGKHQKDYLQPVDGYCSTIESSSYKQPPMIISNTITQAGGRIGHSSEELGYIEKNMYCGQLRRLTPRECFRLQGFLNDEVNLDGLSDTQCYKLAGNGQSVNVVVKIFEKMFQEHISESSIV